MSQRSRVPDRFPNPPRPPRPGQRPKLPGLALAAFLALTLTAARVAGSLTDYDAAIDTDITAGRVPASRRTAPVTLTGTTRVPWNFGNVSGDAAFEFIVQGDPSAQSGYLAVGANVSSNLRFAQFPRTGQLGFTQLGVKDYAFTPPVPSPTTATHVVYAWSAAQRTMRLYRDGVLAGTATGVDAAFALPTGAGWLGSNPGGTEAMTGILHRLTVYDDPLPETVIRSHAAAFSGVFPVPVIHEFTADRVFFKPGDALTATWRTENGLGIRLDPWPGDVTALTRDGRGSVTLHPTNSLRLTLEVTNRLGTAQASLLLRRTAPAGHPVISEIVADDRSLLADEDGEHSGWIEILNPTPTAISLEGCSLTDDPANPARWRFPATNLAPGGFLVVFASGKDRAIPGRPLHTNFQLRNSGEFLALTAPAGAWQHAFRPAYPSLSPNTAYGIHGGDPNTAGFLAAPTPGQSNPDRPVPPVEVGISPAGGTFTNAQEVTLTHPDPDAEIRYTLDGTEPGQSTGLRYTNAFPIGRSTHVRAVAIAQGLPGPVRGRSYLRLAPNLIGYTSSLPLLVIENFGAGPIRQKGWNSTGAGLRQVPRQTATWATFERTAGATAFTQPPQMIGRMGIRGRGAYSSEWRQKPYSVEAMDEAGRELDVSPLDLPAHADWILYFPDADPSRDPTLLFNTFAYDLSRSFGNYSVRFRWVEAFINEDGGDLSLEDRRGVYAIVERVARGANRLDFERLSNDGSTGGWLININRMDPEPEQGWPAPNGTTRPSFFHTAGPDRILQTRADTAYGTVPGDDHPQQPNAYINFDNPNGYVINTAQRAAIEGWFRQFEAVLYNNNLWRNPTNGYRRLLDTRDFIDYFILNTLTRNGDGLLISMFPWKGDDGRLRMGPAWDYNWASYYVSGGPTGSLLHRSERLWYARLFADPDFAQEYIDRWWALRTGPLAGTSLAALVDRQAAEITPSKSLLNGIPSTAEWTRRLTQMKSWLRQRADWIDSQYLAPPTLNHPGGSVPDGFAITLTSATGTLYLTTDGTDPRAPGGSVSPSARPYTGPLIVREPLRLQARARLGATWSGLRSASFTPPQNLTALRLSELMYHPAPFGSWSADNLEFVELRNHGSQALELGGLTLTNGILFRFAPGTRLEAGAFLVLGRNPEALQARYPGLALHGAYSGQLDNGGEQLQLIDGQGNTLWNLTYDDRPPWPIAADGSGRSLVPRDDDHAAPAPDAPNHWRASTESGGSPGTEDPPLFVLPPLNQSSVPGQPITFSVALHPGVSQPAQVRWQRNEIDLPGESHPAPEHRAFLSLPQAQPPTARYRAVLSNAEFPDGIPSRSATLEFLADSDADGMADLWETFHGLNPADPLDRWQDSDGDGASNQAEFQAGTAPTQARSVLTLEVVAAARGPGYNLRFHAQPGRTYALETCDDLPSGRWTRLAEFPAEAMEQLRTLPLPTPAPSRYLRLVTPVTAP